jgi:hypothetical protein
MCGSLRIHEEKVQATFLRRGEGGKMSEKCGEKRVKMGEVGW